MYFLSRIFPFWALPTAYLLAEIGRHYRRRRSDMQYTLFSGAGALVLLSVLWVIFGGYKYSDQWVKYILAGD